MGDVLSLLVVGGVPRRGAGDGARAALATRAWQARSEGVRGRVRRSSADSGRDGIVKRTPLRSRSKKAQRIAPLRRRLVEEMLEDAVCAARLAGCTWRATEVHERLSRARGGSILDRENCVALCAACHFHVTTHPREGHELGLLLHSWEAH